MTAYYNECDPYAAQWLRNLIAAGLIVPGDVDDRKIEEVRPDDLRGYAQCHFFAGIGGWSAALRLAEWPDDKPVWTGSCPCQPFSAAGKQEGVADPRHLWPVFFDLIRQCRPAIVFGEQVPAAIRHGWLDLVQTDLESADYACGAAVFGAHSVGAPHARQRLWWCGLADNEEFRRKRHILSARDRRNGPSDCYIAGRMDDPQQFASDQRCESDVFRGWADQAEQTGLGGDTGGVANGDGAGQPTTYRSIRSQRGYDIGRSDPACRVDHNLGNGRGTGWKDNHSRDVRQQLDAAGGNGWPSPLDGFWRDSDWLYCRDEKWRPVECGSFPLAYGIPGRVGRVCADQERLAKILPRKDQGSRVGRLRGYGNAIVPQAGAAWVKIVMGAMP